MTFIIDAHLPKALITIVEKNGHQAIHTSSLPDGNASSDTVIIQLAEKEKATVVTKDEDFYYSFLLHRKPPKLIMVKVGNMRLKALKELFEIQFPKIVDLLSQHDLIEVHETQLIAID